MIRIAIVVTALVVAGCGSDGEEIEVPSCQQAVSHYYDSGCAYFDVEGTPITRNAVVSDCQYLLSDVPSSCENDFDMWLVCLDSTPANATTDAACDCSLEFEALLTCE